MIPNKSPARYAVRASTMAFAFLAISLILCAAVQKEKPTLTREKLLQAIDKARKGDKEEVVKARNTLQRPETINVPKELLPDFVGLLKEDDPDIQIVGTLGLWILKTPESKDALLEYLKKKDFEKLEKMVKTGQIGERAYECEMRASSFAILALGDIGDKSVIPLLESFRGVKDLKFEFGGGPIQEALAKLGMEGIESLSKLGPDANSQEVMQAEKAIRQIRDPKHIPALIATVKNGNCAESIRVAAIGAIGDMKSDDALPFILTVMKDRAYPQYVRETAVKAAGRSPNPEAEKAILEMAKPLGGQLRSCALVTLAARDPDKFLPNTIKVLLDPSTHTEERERIAKALSYVQPARIEGESYELAVRCLKAETTDGKPADLVRVFVWKFINKTTGKELPLEVTDEKVAYRWLSHDIEMATRRANVHASVEELRRMVNEKMKSIVVRWQPEGGGKNQ